MFLGTSSQRFEIEGLCDMWGRKQKYIERLYGWCEGTRPLGRPRCKWDDLKLDLK